MFRQRAVLLLIVVLTLSTSIYVTSSVQAAVLASTSVARVPRPTRTPVPRTPTPIPTPIPTPSPTPQPTCWTLSPNPALPGSGADLRDVAGSGPNDAWAVGTYDDPNAVRHTLVEHWNGTSWQVVPSPDIVFTGTSINNVLDGVAVIAPNDVWAVGYGVSTSAPYQTLTLHWDGTAWRVVSSPNLTRPGSYNALNDVAAISSNDVWAVGGTPPDLSAVAGRAVLLHWDGIAWQLVPEPPEVINWSSTTLSGVAARATNDVWATSPFGVWHWDGTAWHTFSGFSGQSLSDIDSTGAELWSIGTYAGYCTSEGGCYPPLPNAQHYTGTVWQMTSPINPDVTNGSAFNAVKVIAPTNVWAVGRVGRLALSEKWTGTQWTVVTAANGNPNPPTNRSVGNVLLGVNAISATNIWAVGYYYDNAGIQRPLIEQYICQ